MSYAQTLFNLLKKHNEKIVFAESCTAGRVSSMLAEIPGASNFLCGSYVTYRAEQKKDMLGIKQELIDEFTTESREMAEAMCMSALANTTGTDWAASIVGHLGPGAPDDKDGIIHCCIGGYGWREKGNEPDFYCFGSTLASTTRSKRMVEAVEILINNISLIIEGRIRD